MLKVIELNMSLGSYAQANHSLMIQAAKELDKAGRLSVANLSDYLKSRYNVTVSPPSVRKFFLQQSAANEMTSFSDMGFSGKDLLRERWWFFKSKSLSGNTSKSSAANSAIVSNDIKPH